MPWLVDNNNNKIQHIFHNRYSTSELKAYWRDVGTLDSYWQANMELVSTTPQLNLCVRARRFSRGGGGILNSEGLDYPRILNSGGAAAGGVLNSECLGTHSLTTH